jgi:single-strand DNA-binding protein
MPNLNRVLLMGNLTRDPELRYTPNNVAICKIGLAVNRSWTDRNTNEKKEEVTFIDCDAFGRTAEVIGEHFRKGRPIFIEGRLKLDQWQDKEGKQRSKLTVAIESFTFIGGKDDGGQQDSLLPEQPPKARLATQPPARQSPAAKAPLAEPHEPITDDRIPF